MEPEKHLFFFYPKNYPREQPQTHAAQPSVMTVESSKTANVYIMHMMFPFKEVKAVIGLSCRNFSSVILFLISL